jgi:GAF domain-containing protein
LGNVVESFADAAGVTRVGIFSRRSQGESYRLRAGLRCLGETYDLEFDERDPLVRWFERRAVVMARANLNQTADLKERTLMWRALDSFGAEAIVPLFARDQILGWVFLGQRLGGQGFDDRDLEVAMMLAERFRLCWRTRFCLSKPLQTLAETSDQNYSAWNNRESR